MNGNKCLTLQSARKMNGMFIMRIKYLLGGLETKQKRKTDGTSET